MTGLLSALCSWVGWLLPGGPARLPSDDFVSFQAPTITVEGFLQALSRAVDRQFEERKRLSVCD